MVTSIAWLLSCNADLPPVLTFDDAPPVEVLAGGVTTISLHVADEAAAAVLVEVSGASSVVVDGPTSAGAVDLSVTPPVPGSYTLAIVVTDPGGQRAAVEWSYEAVTGDQDEDGFVGTRWGGPDCDDVNADVHPAASEVCDDVDEDCDGTVDDDPLDGIVVWPDVDRDGFGDQTAAPGRACGLTSGWTDNAEDCADANALVFPRQVQVGYEGCEGFGLAATWLGQAAEDAAGDQVQSGGDFDGDGTLEVAIAAPQANRGAGVVYVVETIGPGEASLGTAGVLLRGTARGDNAGYDIAALGDWDGDGVGDLAVGAPGADGRVGNEGAVYLVFGPVRGDWPLAEVAGHRVFGAAPGDALGAVAFAGDTDGDGVGEVVVGAPASNIGGTTSGYVAFFDVLPPGDSSIADVAEVMLIGESGSAAGDPAPGADLDGDGLKDLLIGAQTDGANGTDAGAVYVVLGPAGSGTWTLDSADAKFLGPAGGLAGHALDIVGDVDQDGRPDFVIGAPYADDKAGIVYLVLGDGSSGVYILTTDARALIGGETAGDRAGFSLAGPGDLNGDGRLDLAIGAKFEDAPGLDGGAVYVTDADLQGVVVLGEQEMKLVGEGEGDLFGDVAAVGDLDGDGLDDLVVGAREHVEAGVATGAAYVVFGAAF